MSIENALEYGEIVVICGKCGGIIGGGMEPIFLRSFFCFLCHFLSCFWLGAGIGNNWALRCGGNVGGGNGSGGCGCPSNISVSFSDNLDCPFFQA